MTSSDTNKICAIVIPVWKRMISEPEFRSLSQCRRILGGNQMYDIILVSKEGVDEKYYRYIWEASSHPLDKSEMRIVKFPDRCFESRLSYSGLLSSKAFYERFRNYPNILIYQLDAWVFSDSLSEWCDKGYDYIGAPWCHLCRMGRGKCKEWISEGFVGNGGLSLRRTDSFMRHLPYDGFDDALYSNSMTEDLYVSLISAFRRPKCDEASRFSVETNARFLISEYGKGELPFGFHGLAVYDRSLYEKMTSDKFQGGNILEWLKTK